MSRDVPLATVLNRFNYPVAWRLVDENCNVSAGEGSSPDNATCIEPTRLDQFGYGFSLFDRARNVVRDLRQLPKTAPNPQVTFMGGDRYSFSLENFPTEYSLNGTDWAHVDVNAPWFDAPQGPYFEFHLRNAHGASSIGISR